MDMGSEELEGIDSASKIWGNLLNQEQLRQLGLDQPEPKKGDKKRQKTQPERTDRDSRSTSSTAVPNEVLKQLIRLTLRHEDHLNCLMQESQFLIHMNPGKGSIVPTLLQASQQWHAAKEKDMSLRHHLACTMIQTLELRLQKLISATPTEELFTDCVKYHLICPDQDRTMPFLRWSPQKQSLQPTSAQGLPIKEVQRCLGNIQRIMADPQVTLRFHALTKPKEGKETTQAIPWLWTVSLRVSPELWHELNRLSYHSIWQLIQIRLRPQPLERQPLAKQLQKAL
jgi:hypothetical protein